MMRLQHGCDPPLAPDRKGVYREDTREVRRNIPMMARSSDQQFVLISANKSRGGAHWSPDDYDVRDNLGKVVGRIMLHPQTPKDQPWFWTITAREMPPSVHNHGYSASREQAMADFKARWLQRVNG